MFKQGNRLGKLVLSGSLVLALSVPVAGMASAQTTSTAPQPQQAQTNGYTFSSDTWSQLAGQYGIDLQTLLQQLQSRLGSGASGNFSFGGSGTGSGSGSDGGDYGYGYGSGSDDGSGGSGSDSGADQGTGSGSTGGSDSGSDYGTGSSTGGTSGSGATGGNSAGDSGSDAGSTVAQSDYASQVVDLVNQERAKQGLSALQSDAKLTTVALAKAKDMYSNNYFDHNSPTYGSPFDMMKQFGVSYSWAGENIAKGQRDPQEVMTAWMNSSGHRANILNAHYTSIGVAYYNGEWVQEFTG
jgi:uncharacterized YkwD family protein